MVIFKSVQTEMWKKEKKKGRKKKVKSVKVFFKGYSTIEIFGRCFFSSSCANVYYISNVISSL